ncbi:BACON domain-containing protein [Bacteroides heparinolyticus]|uniref:BACON domain-containing protein n=1 Tax=Prevotella heparinolytica TaxID=28113 RepID=UPI0035A15E70
MKPLKLFSILFFVLILFLLSCSEEKTPQTLEVDKTKLHFPIGTVSREFSITTSGEWIIEATGMVPLFGPNRGDADWYTVEPIGGKGNAKITVTSKEKTAGNAATLKIKYDGKEKIVELQQDAASEGT